MNSVPPPATINDGLIWILHTTGMGANHQLRALARSTGARIEIKHCLDGSAMAFFERLARFPARFIPSRKRQLLQPPWPDLVLFGGGRSVVDAWRIRQASGGHSRLVCIGRPAAALDAFDLVLTTPQYRLPRHPRVLHLPLPFHDPGQGVREHVAVPDDLSRLPRPWVGVLLGGDSGSYRWTEAAGRQLGTELERLGHRCQASLAISTSPRTPGSLSDAISGQLSRPHYLYRWRADDKANPFDAILAGADAFVVTADSASMLAEACATGRPVASYAPPLRLLARVLQGRELSLGSWREWATAAGWWIPVRDMHRIHAGLAKRGLIADIAELDLSNSHADSIPPEWQQARQRLIDLLETTVAERRGAALA